MKLTRKDAGEQGQSAANLFGSAINRRTFLRNSGITAGGAAVVVSAGPSMLRKAHAAEGEDNRPKDGVETVKIRSVCTHCSVGCGVIAEVQNGVWTGQEPDYDSPLNLGSHCAKGASVREHGHGERRLKTPMKLLVASGKARLGYRHQRDWRSDAEDPSGIKR